MTAFFSIWVAINIITAGALIVLPDKRLPKAETQELIARIMIVSWCAWVTSAVLLLMARVY